MDHKAYPTETEIGLIIYGLDRNPSGIGQYSIRILESMKLMGCSPAILQSGGWPKNFDPGEYQISAMPGARLLPALLTLGQAQIGWITRKNKLKVVHDPNGIAPFAFCQAKRVVTLHDIIPLSIRGNSTLAETIIYRYWLPVILPRVDAVITDSQCSKKDICKYFHMPAEEIAVISAAAGRQFCPMSEMEVEPVIERHHLRRPYILDVCSLEPRKNLLRLVEAFATLHKELAQYKLVIVGARNVWKSSPVARVVMQKGLQDSVIFTGYVPDEDLPAMYNGADLFCFPSLYEGFGLPVLEAMACGTPVVTSNSSSLPEVAGEAALLVDPYDVEAIADAMHRILEDDALAQDLREKGLARASQFSWEKTARETIAVYEKVLGEKLL